ncbi:hypothetical protein EBL_c02220 [Shimwellia blattae DSM 4481 = NBRC 105725]|uniref:Uncharacterized protein n=1 Tax=Shimwellia blattae (strain ATCC 29907 / DSM 4481 / JCM 1650 / NBRC 105725 / CDC 9005-74) TaxID=630626 RepID=I2B4A3_SHIBC|nr:hypothetical protein EBL_c02220 [Shimwellia blattae DSM 4481 = NBRC 105725]
MLISTLFVTEQIRLHYFPLRFLCYMQCKKRPAGCAVSIKSQIL